MDPGVVPLGVDDREAAVALGERRGLAAHVPKVRLVVRADNPDAAGF